MIDCQLRNNLKEITMREKNAGADSDNDSEEQVLDVTDYGFILSEDGELKSLLIPEDAADDLPENVILILDILGIDLTAPKETRSLH